MIHSLQKCSWKKYYSCAKKIRSGWIKHGFAICSRKKLLGSSSDNYVKALTAKEIAALTRVDNRFLLYQKLSGFFEKSYFNTVINRLSWYVYFDDTDQCFTVLQNLFYFFVSKTGIVFLPGRIQTFQKSTLKNELLSWDCTFALRLTIWWRMIFRKCSIENRLLNCQCFKIWLRSPRWRSKSFHQTCTNKYFPHTQTLSWSSRSKILLITFYVSEYVIII